MNNKVKFLLFLQLGIMLLFCGCAGGEDDYMTKPAVVRHGLGLIDGQNMTAKIWSLT